MSRLYEDLETADAAKTAAYDRLNTLADEYEEMVSRFTTSVTAELPVATDTQLQSLIAAYAAKIVLRDDAEEAITSAQTVLLAGQAGVDTALERRSEFEDLASALTARLQEMNLALAGVGLVTAMVDTYEGLSPAEQATILALLPNTTTVSAAFRTSGGTVLPVITDGVTQHQAMLNTYQGEYGAKSVAYSRAMVGLNRNKKDYEQSVAAQSAAREQEEAALAAIRDVCPAYNPQTGATT